MKRPKQPERDENDPSRAVLREIYRPSGVASDLQRFERKPRNRKRRLLFLLLGFFVLASALAIAGLSVFTPKKQFSGGDITVSFSGAAQASTGDEYALTVSVKNSGKISLRNLELTVRYPDGFQYVSSTPNAANEFSNAWELGTLGKNETKSVRVSGRLIGELGSEKTFLATAVYEPSNFSSQFQTEADFTTRISASVLELDITAPHAVTNGQEVTYELKATNTSDETLGTVRLELTYPDGLAEITTDPKPTEGEARWDRDGLKAGESYTVTVKGKLSGTPKTVTELKAKLGMLDTTSTFLTQREESALVLILEPTLNIGLTSGSKSAGHPVNSRDTIDLHIDYSNDSDNNFTDVAIEVRFSGKDSDGAQVALVDMNGVKSPTSFIKTTDANGIRWTKDEIGDFARLVPGTKGAIDVTVPLVGNLRSLGSGMNFALDIQAVVSAKSVDTTGSAYEAKSDTLTFPVNTELRLAVEGRYYAEEGEPIGNGPLPPSVGSTTTYVIFWYLTNTMNGATDALLTAKLPDDVTFISAETSGGNNITFDATSREVRWRIAKVDARVGQTLPTLVGSFRVSITPVESDIGKTKTLLGKTSVSATDAFTASKLSLTGDAVSTDLTNDSGAQGKGEVVAGAGTNDNSNTPGEAGSGSAGNTPT